MTVHLFNPLGNGRVTCRNTLPWQQPTERSNAWPAPTFTGWHDWHVTLNAASENMGTAWRFGDDDGVAWRHGWGVFECMDREHGPYEIQYDQDEQLFECDEGAWLHVYMHAAHPGADFEYTMLCRRALTTVRVHNRPHWDDIMAVVSEHLLSEMLLVMAYEP